MFLCLVYPYRNISLSAGPICFSFTGYLLISSEKFYKYFGEGLTILPPNFKSKKSWVVYFNFSLLKYP